jgi:hypothetical protein
VFFILYFLQGGKEKKKKKGRRGVAEIGNTVVGEDAILLTLSGPALHCVLCILLLRKEKKNWAQFDFI